MEFKSLFKDIFKVDKQKMSTHQRLQMLNDYTPVFYHSKIEDSIAVQSCIRAIATHCSKFEMHHKKYVMDKVSKSTKIYQINGDINYLLQYKPNPINVPSQFLYKIVSNLLMNNNSFVYIDRDKEGMIKGFYPITSSKYELLEDTKGTIFLRFTFVNNKTYELPYVELIHLRNNYQNHEIFGDSNRGLKGSVATSNTARLGIENAVKSTASLRGILKFSNSILKESDMKKYKDSFVTDYLNMENESGIASLDAKADFTPVKLDPITLSDSQLSYLDNSIYKYFGVNENIINSSFTPDQWNAFYESVLEPIAIQMEQEFTTKIFGEEAIKAGNRIIFSVERIKYAKTETKINLISQLGALGIYTVDEARAVLDMPPIGGEEGAKRLQSLNYVNSNLADEYQVGNEEGNNEGN